MLHVALTYTMMSAEVGTAMVSNCADTLMQALRGGCAICYVKYLPLLLLCRHTYFAVCSQLCGDKYVPNSFQWEW